jgi:hypothetical protein
MTSRKRNTVKPTPKRGKLRQKESVAEARRQSRMVASSKDDGKILRWMENLMDTTGWKESCE